MECQTISCVWFDKNAPQNCAALNGDTLEMGCPEPELERQGKKKVEWKPKPLTPEEEAWAAQTKEGCKGKIYRCKMNSFINSQNEYVYQERMRPMLRMSCKGCDHCAFLYECLDEIESEEGIEIDDIEHGALYFLTYIPDAPNWESGISESGNLKFIKIKEKL